MEPQSTEGRRCNLRVRALTAAGVTSSHSHASIHYVLPVPFDLTFQNTGTGFLTVSELTTRFRRS
jgi:hypothetical protein